MRRRIGPQNTSTICTGYPGGAMVAVADEESRWIWDGHQFDLPELANNGRIVREKRDDDIGVEQDVTSHRDRSAHTLRRLPAAWFRGPARRWCRRGEAPRDRNGRKDEPAR